MSKWIQFRSKLERLLPGAGGNEEYQKKIRQTVDYYTKEKKPKTLNQLGKIYIELRAKKRDLEADAKYVNLRMEALSRVMLDRFEDDGITSFKTPADVTLFIRDEPYASIEDRPKVIQWIKDNDHAELLGIQWQTFNALMKEFLLDGKKIPPGVKLYLKSNISAR
jgi:hypothetical protein